MDFIKMIMFLVVALFISAAVADVEVLNDVEDKGEDFLEMEQFIPADAIAKQNVKSAHRNLASVKQSPDTAKGINSDLKVPVAATNTQKPAQQDNKNNKNTNGGNVKHMTSHDASANQRGVPAKSGSPQSDDDVNLADEGFLLEDGKSRNGRKLTQYLEPDSNSRYRNYVDVMAQDDSDKNVKEDNKPTTQNPSSSSNKSSKSSPSSSTTSSQTTGTSQESGKHKVEAKVGDSRHKPSQKIKDMREETLYRGTYLDLDDLDDFGLEHDEWAALNIACRDDESSWECLMFKEDYLAMRHDANLSNRGVDGGHKRLKRQSNNNNGNRGNNNGNNGNGRQTVTVPPVDETIAGDSLEDTQDMGSGIDLVYNETETVKNPTIVIKSNLTFNVDDDNNGNNNNKYKNKTKLTKEEKDEIKLDLENQLKDLYKNVTGFKNVSVNPDSIRVVNGSIVVDYNVTIDTGDPGFKGQNPEQINRTIVDDLGKVNGTYRDGINLNGTKPLGEFPFDDFKDQLNGFFDDPCAQDPENFPCSDGYDQCRVVGDLELECTHRCVMFQILHPCEHSSQCDLDMNFEPYCACTKNWEGEYCEKRVEATDLDGGEITGIVIGGILTTAGIVGCCCWFLLCFRKSSDMVWSHYTDEEGTGSVSNNPNFNCVIDRPHVSQNPFTFFSDPTTQKPLFQGTMSQMGQSHSSRSPRSVPSI